MDPNKEKQLDQTFENLVQAIAFDFPLDKIDTFMIPDVLIYGTNRDEKADTIEQIRDLIELQREQARGVKFNLARKPVLRRIMTGENSAVIVEEMTAEIEADDVDVVIPMRATAVLEFFGNKWNLVHSHWSQPVDAEKDAFLTEKWKKEKEELEKLVKQRTKSLEESLENLKIAQDQLVKQEKLASLGQLTAGIAHEIKNPLNFVNNFSEVSLELLEEARALSEDGNQELESIFGDIEKNLEKIHDHGERADNIVRQMLQHSRGNSGERSPVDLNSMVDEYLNLAHHGMRAADKSFQIEFQTDYDEHIPSLHLVVQDMGRALINLFNNGMYAAHEYARESEGRTPTLSVRTVRNNDEIEIHIRDNGGGIPDGIRDKIFDPFFTTKPAGDGTGLGLSLTYDIIKMQGGTLDIESNEGEYTECIITLPLNHQTE